jgi:hypothetical protein
MRYEKVDCIPTNQTRRCYANVIEIHIVLRRQRGIFFFVSTRQKIWGGEVTTLRLGSLRNSRDVR